ncbi:MAG TPA: hypothetical protein VGN16_17480 [Acidobacteriaceae bacterium]|jgi:hypothetical protein
MQQSKMFELLDEEAEDTPSKNDRYPSRAWGLTLGVCLFPVYLIFSAFGMRGRGTVAACALGMLLLAAKIHSDKKSTAAFWIVLCLFALLNGLLVAFIPWPNRDYALPLVLPIGVCDYLLMSLILRKVCTGIPSHRQGV